MRSPPPPAEICKRRGLTLVPIVTKCFDETMDGEDFLEVIRIRLPMSPGAGQDNYSRNMRPGIEEISSWSSTTEDSSSDYSELETESEFDYEESCEDKLERYRQFFDNGPLIHSLNDSEDQMLADLLFDRLLIEVQKPGLPFEEITRDCRGEVQVRAFWDDVRKQLQLDESSEDERPDRLI